MTKGHFCCPYYVSHTCILLSSLTLYIDVCGVLHFTPTTNVCSYTHTFLGVKIKKVKIIINICKKVLEFIVPNYPVLTTYKNKFTFCTQFYRLQHYVINNFVAHMFLVECEIVLLFNFVFGLILSYLNTM